MSEVKGKLDGSVKFYLAGQKHPGVGKSMGSAVANRKTNGVNKSDEVGCKWAALTALLSLQERAKKRGANAVVDVVSYYKKSEFSSATEYECHAGGIIIGAAWRGNFAKIGR